MSEKRKRQTISPDPPTEPPKGPAPQPPGATFKPGVREQLVAWTYSPDAGDPDCLCSFCRQVIEEDEMPLRIWPEGGAWEFRLHMPKCTDQVIDWGSGK